MRKCANPPFTGTFLFLLFYAFFGAVSPFYLSPNSFCSLQYIKETPCTIATHPFASRAHQESRQTLNPIFILLDHETKTLANSISTLHSIVADDILHRIQSFSRSDEYGGGLRGASDWCTGGHNIGRLFGVLLGKRQLACVSQLDRFT